jgi:hypothetical protein
VRPPVDTEALLQATCRVAYAIDTSGGLIERLEITQLLVYLEGRSVHPVDLLVRPNAR